LKDDKSTITSYEVYFSLYQQLTGGEETETTDENAEDETISKLESLFKPDFFDLVVVDECHRGSAKKDSNWRNNKLY
jgi:type I restriction enzyme R subunit